MQRTNLLKEVALEEAQTYKTWFRYYYKLPPYDPRVLSMEWWEFEFDFHVMTFFDKMQVGESIGFDETEEYMGESDADIQAIMDEWAEEEMTLEEAEKIKAEEKDD